MLGWASLLNRTLILLFSKRGYVSFAIATFYLGLDHPFPIGLIQNDVFNISALDNLVRKKNGLP